MKTLNVTEVPIPSKFKHPPPPHECLPGHPWTLGLIAPKGSGKTTFIVNFLKFMKGTFHTIVIISPTIGSDPKWEHVKDLDLLVENKKLKQFLKNEEKEEIRFSIVQQPQKPLPPKQEKKFDPKIPKNCFVNSYNQDDLRQLMDSQMQMIEYLTDRNQGMFLANRVLVVLDDMVGSELFSTQKNNPFKTFNTNHRHLSFSVIEVTQAYKEIPKTVRTQFTCGVIFEIPNEKELECIYEEYPLGYSRDKWMQIYKHCTSEDYGFMFFNFQKHKNLRIMKNFDSYVQLGE